MDLLAYFRYNLQQNDTQKEENLNYEGKLMLIGSSCRSERKGHVSRICQRSIIYGANTFMVYTVHHRIQEEKRLRN